MSASVVADGRADVVGNGRQVGNQRLDGLRGERRMGCPHTRACSTIGAERLNFRVRDGNGCDPAPIATGKLVFLSLRCGDGTYARRHLRISRTEVRLMRNRHDN